MDTALATAAALEALQHNQICWVGDRPVKFILGVGFRIDGIYYDFDGALAVLCEA